MSNIRAFAVSVAAALSAVLVVPAPAHAAEAPPEAGRPPKQAEIQTPGQGEDRLQLVGRKMRQSQAMLAAANSGPLAQEAQRDIVADLDRLIAEARKTARQSGEKDPSKSTSRTPPGAPSSNPDSSGQGPGRKPDAKSGDRTAPPPGKQEGAAAALEGMKKVWGTLPPRERAKVLELKAEDFVPKYRQMIEEYYRRLATGE